MRHFHHYTEEEIARMRHFGKLADRVMEFLPPVCTGIMIIHDLALCFGYRYPWTELIIILAAVVMMFLFSYALGFCTLHRSFILYNWMMLFCIHFERTVGFEQFLQPMHYIMLVLGIILLFQLIIKKSRQSLCKHNTKWRTAH